MGQGIAGVDPHKTSVTMAVVDLAGAELSAASFDNTGDGLQAAVVWLAGLGLEIVRVGVEGSAGHGRHLAERLVAAGYDTREVPPRRTAERRDAPGVEPRPTARTPWRSLGPPPASQIWGR